MAFKPVAARQRQFVIDRIEAQHCPNSTDAGMSASNHRIDAGACTICDRSILSLGIHYQIV